MKNKVILCLAGAACLMLGSAFAMDASNMDDKLMVMKLKMNLTDEQVNQVRPIMSDYMTKMENLDKEKDEKMSKVLSSEQMLKMHEMKAEMMRKMEVMYHDMGNPDNMNMDKAHDKNMVKEDGMMMREDMKK